MSYVSGVMIEGRLLGFKHKYISQQHNQKCFLVAYGEGFQVLADHVALNFQFGVKLLEDPNCLSTFYKEQEKEVGYKNSFCICVMVTFINQSWVWQKPKKMCRFDKNASVGMWVDDGVDEFVNVCLDFSIAQYMEDCYFWQTNKKKKKDFAS